MIRLRCFLFNILLLFLGCGINENGNQVNINSYIIEDFDTIDKRRVIEIIDFHRLNDKNIKWNEDTRIIAKFPVYMSDNEQIAFYEYKLKTGNINSGYVLLPAKGMEKCRYEICTDGITLTEEYQLFTGSENIKVVRFNSIESKCINLIDNSIIAVKSKNGINLFDVNSNYEHQIIY